MPIHLEFSHMNRLVVIVARGAITPEEMARAIQELLASGALHYRKIVDVTSSSMDIDMGMLAGIAERFRADPQAASRGPLAFVVDPARGDLAKTFASLTEGERPVKVFRSIHEARKWLDENSKIEPRR